MSDLMVVMFVDRVNIHERLVGGDDHEGTLLTTNIAYTVHHYDII